MFSAQRPPAAAAPARPEGTAVNTQATYIGEHRVLLRNAFSLKMFVDSRDLSLTPHLILDGTWEMANTQFLRWHLKPGMHFVEVGANVGYYTLLASQCVGPRGRVIAVEANPHMAKLTRDNLEINGFSAFAEVVQAAAYSENTTLPFSCLRDHIASSSLFMTDAYARKLNDSADVITVDARRLDDIVPAGVRVDAIKIDAEGAELHCLRGAQRLLRENPEVVLMLEHSAALVSADGVTSRSALYDFCHAAGMKCYRVADQQLLESDFEALDAAGLCDIVCTRKSL